MNERTVSAGERRLITFAALTATLMQTLDTTIANVALPHMRGDLSASQEQIGWVLTSYIVATAIATAPAGYLASRFGVRRIFLIAVAGFTVSSVLCGLATSLEQMVAYRCLQGLFSAALVPLSQTVLLDVTPPSQQGSALAIWGIGIMVGPVLGPLAGGWLTENFSWHWIFFINVPIGIASYVALGIGLRRDGARRVQRFDFLGFTFLTIAIGALQLMLDRGHILGWFDSVEVMIECAVALMAFYLFVVHISTTDQPFISPALLRNRNLVGGLVLISLLGLVIFSTFAILPPFLQEVQNYPVITAGVVMAPRGIGSMLTMLVVGRLIDRIDVRLPMAGGLLLMAFSSYWMAGFSVEVPAWQFVVSGVVQGVGMGLLLVPLSAVAVATLSQEMRSEGTALYSLMRNIGSSVGIALAFAYQDYGTKMARSALVENVHYANPALIEWFSREPLLGTHALALLEAEVQRQASAIGVLGNFHYLSIATLLALPLLLLLRPIHGNRAG
jgi:DHA2 family multidrug resistance protein